MFPYTITIYTYNEDTETYDRQVVKGVWWTGSDSVPISETRSHDASTTVVIPKSLMNSVSVKNGCYIAKGEQKDIESMEELEEMESIQVTSVQINDVGCELDNITINGN